MRIVGVDFTSTPSRRKPLTCAICDLDDGTLAFVELATWRSFADFEQALSSPGPWVAGLDFPFGQPRRLIEAIGWPTTWLEYVTHASSLGRAGFRSALDAYRVVRAAGDKEHRRSFDVMAGSISPQKLYGVPVGLMFFEGAQRVALSGAAVPGLLDGDPSRVVFEVYPGVAARNLIGRRSYKNDARQKQTAEQRDARLRIHRELTGGPGHEIYGFEIHAPADLCEDPSADDLDALLCGVQAAWAWRNLDACLAELSSHPPHEGWIADPSLFTFSSIGYDRRPGSS